MWYPHRKAQLTELKTLCESFAAAGVQSIADGADTSDRANATRLELGLEEVELGYEMLIETARDLGTFILFGINDCEMLLFCKPANFLILNETGSTLPGLRPTLLRIRGFGLRRIHTGAPWPRTARFRLTRRLAELRGHGQGAYASAFSDPLVRKKCRASHIAVTAIAVR